MENKSAQANAVKRAYDPSASADELYTLLRLAGASGMKGASEHILNRLKTEFHQSGDIRFMLENAIASRAFGDTDGAIEKFIATQNKYPNNGHAYILHSDLLVENGEWETARCVLESGWKHINEKKLKLEIIYRIIKLNSRAHAAATSTPLWPASGSHQEPKAAFIMMARDENDIIRKNLEHHYRIGFRKFIIVDNNSSDGTTSNIDYFSVSHHDSTVVRISDPVAGYFQGEKTSAAVDFAKSYFSGVGQRIDWIFILDADEFLSGPSSMSGLSDLIGAAEQRAANYMTFPLCNAAPHRKIDIHFDNQNIYEDFHTVAAYPPRLVMKNAFHVELRCRITTGNHILDCDDLDPNRCLVSAEIGWKIIHLPYRTTTQVARKILNGTAAIQARGDVADIGRHWTALGTEMRRDTEATALKKLESYRKETLMYSQDNPRLFRL